MTFEELLARLLKEIGRRIQNGQLTERGLARMAELSQPHVHHILKGKRSITPQVADRFLTVLGMEAGQLFEDQPSPEQSTLDQEPEQCVLLPLLEGLVGPGYPEPRLLPGGLYFPFPASLLGVTSSAQQGATAEWKYMVVRLGFDGLLEGIAEENDLLVIGRPRQSKQWEATQWMIGTPSIWMLGESWVVAGGAHGNPLYARDSAKRKQREEALQKEGSPVALVHWLVRRLRATTIAKDGRLPNRWLGLQG